MAILTKVHGVDVTAPDQFVGRTLHLKNFNKGGAMSQDDLNALVLAVETTCTIELIGAFTAGVSTSINMIVSGTDGLAASPVVAGYTVTDAAF